MKNIYILFVGGFQWDFQFLLLFLTDDLGGVGLWCWITNAKWQFLVYYDVMCMCCLIGGGLWCIILYHINQIRRQFISTSMASAMPVYIVRQTCFVIVFFLQFTFMAGHRLYIALEPNHTSPFGLALAHVVAYSTQGFMLFLIFGCRKVNFKYWKKGFHNFRGKYLRGSKHFSAYESLSNGST